MAINVRKLYKEYIQGNDQLDARRRDVQEDDIVLTPVKLKVENIKWIDKSPPAEPEACRKVDYTQKNAAGSEALGHFQTNKESQNYAKVLLEKGIVRGLKRNFKLPLDTNNKDLIEAFGTHLDVDPSKDESVYYLNKMNIGAALDGEVGTNGATATVCDRQKEYSGHFVCTVIMKGNCLANGGQQQIGEVIRCLQSAQPKNTDLNALSVTKRQGKKGERNVVQFDIEGDLECKWDSNEKVEWTKNA